LLTATTTLAAAALLTAPTTLAATLLTAAATLLTAATALLTAATTLAAAATLLTATATLAAAATLLTAAAALTFFILILHCLFLPIFRIVFLRLYSFQYWPLSMPANLYRSHANNQEIALVAAKRARRMPKNRSRNRDSD
jgi:hypothetical protein